MANGDDTVKVQLTDGRTGTLPKAKADAWVKAGRAKVVDDPLLPKIKAGAKTLGREAALGGFSGLGISETQHPVMDTLKGMMAPADLKDPGTYLGPGYGMAKGAVRSAAEIFEGLGADPKHPMKFGPVDLAKIGHGGGSLLTQWLALKGFKEGEAKSEVRESPATKAEVQETPATMMQKSQNSGRQIISELVNRGPTRERMQLLLDSDALATKSKLAQLDEAAKADIETSMNQVRKAIDDKAPQGSIKPPSVKVPGSESMPKSLQKIADLEDAGKAKTPDATSTLIQKQAKILKGKGLPDADLKGTLVNLGFKASEVDAAMGGGESGLLTAGRAMELRSALGKEIFQKGLDKYSYSVKKAAMDTWNGLTQAIDDAAKQAGSGDGWQQARAKSQQYYENFGGTYDHGKFNMSPINKSLRGSNATDIMEPLSGKTAQQARDAIQKYKHLSPESESVISDTRRYGLNNKVMRFADPQKWDIAVAAVALARPEWGIPAFTMRYVLPRLAEYWLSRRAKGMTTARPSPQPTANAMFEKLFGKEYKEAGDLAEWETGSREGGKATGGWTTPVIEEL
jgi:hypothetical protein